MSDASELLSEDWLKANGFKWHQLDRQPSRHWLLWIGEAVRAGMFASYEDLGVEVAYSRDGRWFCWLRDDAGGRYHRFIHLRMIETAGDLVGIIEGLVGRPFDPALCFYGSLRTPESAARIREADERLDRRLNRDFAPWSSLERDPDGGRPLPEHLEAHEKSRGRG